MDTRTCIVDDVQAILTKDFSVESLRIQQARRAPTLWAEDERRDSSRGSRLRWGLAAGTKQQMETR